MWFHPQRHEPAGTQHRRRLKIENRYGSTVARPRPRSRPGYSTNEGLSPYGHDCTAGTSTRQSTSVKAYTPWNSAGKALEYSVQNVYERGSAYGRLAEKVDEGSTYRKIRDTPRRRSRATEGSPHSPSRRRESQHSQSANMQRRKGSDRSGRTYAAIPAPMAPLHAPVSAPQPVVPKYPDRPIAKTEYVMANKPECKSDPCNTPKPDVKTKVYTVGDEIDAFYETTRTNGKWYPAVIKYISYPKQYFLRYKEDGSVEYETYTWDFGIKYEDGPKVYGINEKSKRTGKPKIRPRKSST